MAIPQNLPKSWSREIGHEFDKDYMLDLSKFLKTQISLKKTIYPKGKNIFNALQLTPYDEVKVVILGQDPYHGKDQAHGLCFSVPQGMQNPPSLQNIFKELKSEYKDLNFQHGDLSAWAKQGVLLLNHVLTVEANKAFSHAGKGWETFTNEVIKKLSDRSKPLIFILWGSAAQKKIEFIDQKKHYILKSAHPSPLSSYRGFFGNNHFKKVNEILIKLGQSPISWQN